MPSEVRIRRMWHQDLHTRSHSRELGSRLLADAEARETASATEVVTEVVPAVALMLQQPARKTQRHR